MPLSAGLRYHLFVVPERLFKLSHSIQEVLVQGIEMAAKRVGRFLDDGQLLLRGTKSLETGENLIKRLPRRCRVDLFRKPFVLDRDHPPRDPKGKLEVLRVDNDPFVVELKRT